MSTELKTEFSRYTPEQLSELYKRDPNQFDEIADDAISQACIGRTPELTLKRRQQQWIIDAQLRKGKTPLERMQIMEQIFYSHVFGENGELAKLIYSCTELIRTIKGPEVSIKEPATLYLVKKMR